jgi:hypothetical protein
MSRNSCTIVSTTMVVDRFPNVLAELIAIASADRSEGYDVRAHLGRASRTFWNALAGSAPRVGAATSRSPRGGEKEPNSEHVLAPASKTKCVSKSLEKAALSANPVPPALLVPKATRWRPVGEAARPRPSQATFPERKVVDCCNCRNEPCLTGLSPPADLRNPLATVQRRRALESSATSIARTGAILPNTAIAARRKTSVSARY